MPDKIDVVLIADATEEAVRHLLRQAGVSADGFDAVAMRAKMVGELNGIAQVDAARRQAPVQYAVQHAPAGGIVIAGQSFKGGEFIPGDIAAQATPEQRTKLVAKEKKTKKKESKEEPEEWDGTIDEDNLVGREQTVDRCVAGWNFTDDGNNYPQYVRIVSSEYDPFPDSDHDHDNETVYRWESYDDGGYVSDRGCWTADEDEARSDGESFAEEHDEPKVEPEPEEEDETEENEEEYPDEIDDAGASDSTPPPKLEKKEKLGKSHARVILQADEAEATAFLGKIFPQSQNTTEDLASALGAPDDAVVKVTHVGPYTKLFADDTPSPGAVGVRVWMDHPKLGRVSRFVGIDGNGRKFIKNEILEVKPQYQREGLGLSIFAKQVENASAAGVEYIETHAAGSRSGTMNGYYTWPRFGYNESLKQLSRKKPKLAERITTEFPGAKTIRDVMSTPEGRDWWKEHGSDLHHAKFDLRENSWSMYILNRYLEERQAKKE